MRSLVQSLHRSKHTGVPLPDRFPSLAAAGIKVRRGQVHMIAGQPGSGKSLVALDYAINAGISCLYFSADSDAATVCARSAAMRLGVEMSEVEAWMDDDDDMRVEGALAALPNTRFVFDPSPTLDVIDGEIKAWIELYGSPPQALVVDNLINLVCETTDNEWQGLRHLMAEMHAIARQTMSAVVVLHHTSEGEGKATEPQMRKALMGKVAQLPELILTVALEPETSELRLCPVKNRSGKADASAREDSWVRLDADLSRMTLREKSHGHAVADWWDGVE